MEVVPTWDGDTSTLARWILRVNSISKKSATVRQQLGAVVPQRLTGDAEVWYYSLPEDVREDCERDWENIREEIGAYYMNRAWVEKTRKQALAIRYRESGSGRELPSQYFIRKRELLELVYDNSESELISEIIAGAPLSWRTVLTPRLYQTTTDLQQAIKLHEDDLLELDHLFPSGRATHPYASRDSRGLQPQGNGFSGYRPRANLAGGAPASAAPPFPKDDSNVSRKGTPESKGRRPCRHCGSGKHWDYECKYARQGVRRARANFVEYSPEELAEQEEYDAYYFDELSDSDLEESTPVTVCQSAVAMNDASTNDPREDYQENDVPTVRTFTVSTHQPSPTALQTLSQRLARVFTGEGARKRRREDSPELEEGEIREGTPEHPAELLELKRSMARPPGCSFLGARATTIEARLQSQEGEQVPVILDSGSDITLISQRTLSAMTNAPRLRAGQKVRLVQVTGTATISGYVPLDLFFDTPDGPVKMFVEAYVVKGMSTPFILGNDFAEQYSISLLRRGGETTVQFGASGRELKVPAFSDPSGPKDDNGHAFLVTQRSVASAPDAAEARRTRRRHIKQRHLRQPRSERVQALETVTIPPGASQLLPIKVRFPEHSDCVYVERLLLFRRHGDHFYGAPDTLVCKQRPMLHVSNFSDEPVRIEKGDVVGYARNPELWLDEAGIYSHEEQERILAHASLIRMLARDRSLKQTCTAHAETPDLLRSSNSETVEEDPLAEEPVEGGPKTSEVAPDITTSESLSAAVDISKELTSEQQELILEIVKRNQSAFALDGRLGTVDAKCTIPLRPGAKEISLPPFPSSPAKREVMDKQMDTWIQLGVIEPSMSPWGAPGFIVYRNGKPRMVIDYRKLNELTIPDEFPLPKQEDIMHALSGAQWLSTMDALAGFTQIIIEEKDRPKTAFRTHRGLWQFRRMPFGLRNGPSIFQRVMQNILAPYLFVFALVYIDDIVVYSRTFEEHLEHLDRVLNAIKQAGITLSPSKCHLGYHSLMLLGQKVSRLGLSTHKDKVDAIVELAPPKNVHELQVFLGMMVYFSAYIPFYAWLAAPLFRLLKSSEGWDWTELHQEAFDLCKQALVQAPVRAHAMPGKPYRIYSDACDYGLAAILQQVQPIKIRDLRGTKTYARLERAYRANEPIPRLVAQIVKDQDDVPEPGSWAADFEETEVHIERVIAYWSRILKSAERNYSPTEREALALREGLIKFQAYIEGESVVAVTDHAALTWSKTFQNVNRRLLTWGTTFAAYPGLRIVHRAGRVHSNVDPISRLRRRIPFQEGPSTVPSTSLTIGEQTNDPLKNTFEELGPHFEEKVLEVASQHTRTLQVEENDDIQAIGAHAFLVGQEPPFSTEDSVTYHAAGTGTLLVGIAETEVRKWRHEYLKDPHYRQVLESFRVQNDPTAPTFPQYFISDEGLIYFEDWNGASRLCVPDSLRLDLIKEVHDVITEGAHAGYHRTYNRIASCYYWPRMSRDVKRYTLTCDICQKSKPRRHAPIGLLQPIPIPSRPFEVVSMDFIPELPLSGGFDNVLIIIDKLTKYGLFIPTTTTISAEETAKLFFHHVVAHYGLPRQVITDRDVRWSAGFWEQLCKNMDIRRALTTSHHPQADGQTEILNQSLEIALRAYVSPKRDDWSEHLDALMLSYNTTPHSATNYAPAYLLRGYLPITGSTLLSPGTAIPRPTPRHLTKGGESPGGTDSTPLGEVSLHQGADEMAEHFIADRHRAQQALKLGQAHQQRAYNKGRLRVEFQEGDQVVINPHSLELLRQESGRGRKLLMKYDGPFEIMQKVSPVAYRLRLPASYGIHPVINIAHLEAYHPSPPELGERPRRRLHRADFAELPEVEVEKIVAQRWKPGKKGQRIIQYRTRFVDMGPEEDEWLTRRELRNAPDVLAEWHNQGRLKTRDDNQEQQYPPKLSATSNEQRKLTARSSNGTDLLNQTRAVAESPQPRRVGLRYSRRVAQREGRRMSDGAAT
ncbi:hypothetical protein NUW54_g3453 [Trametes sanguinea]|uniref:Uncharacterized protein n=1 Tax=Trametes sanguinea TaxID=158606 RepID=A0ACC1Q1V3_9APHY|nr:hypothetical protein NUW54_g3453 [Trametes sanguinea]